jgi:putative tryptophan/tyrosine transport system substrate-binding protein
MKRREFIAGLGGAALAMSLPALAQPARKPVIGMLFHSNPEPPLTLIRNALGGLGYRNGDTAEFDIRVADGSDARLAEMAAGLVVRKVDVIVAFTTPAALAARGATSSIPIVMGGVADPVGSGLVASLARPGGNITGVSAAIAETSGKILGLLREVIPAAARIGVLVNTADPFHVRLIEQIEIANRIVKVELRIFRVAKREEIAAAFEAMAAQKIDAAIIQPTLPRAEVIALSIRHKLPTGSAVRGYGEDGGFLAYGGNLADQSGVVAGHVDRILKGAKPADIPVQQPTKFELVINVKTAKVLGVEIPTLLLAQADEVIE